MSARKRGLGRGLDSLLKVEAPAALSLPHERLQPNRLQPRSRFEGDDLDELAESIRSQGVVQPIVVTPRADGDYDIIAGERRWRAARRAGLEQVPVAIREVADDRQRLELALVENVQRTDLNPVEEARAYRTLSERFELSQEEIALRVGKSRTTISNAVRLLKLPAEIQELLSAGRLTAGQARPLLAISDEQEQLRLAKQAADGGLTARALEQRAAGKRRSRQSPRIDPDTDAAAERLTRRLQTRVTIRRRGGGGTVRIAFHSEEELMRLFDLLMQTREKR
ncbi:MAG: ParB/RepB/Spo0J family partition protein [Thermoanaerobaculia bacterium]|nr:ParB/RepB/Spo0J family partition protein [Thermoanaerobaculia bacterium]